MFFLQESTPDTALYMIAGYTVAFTIMGIYLVSLFLRWRNLDRDLQTLEILRSESRPARPGPRKPALKKSARKTPRKKAGPGKKK